MEIECSIHEINKLGGKMEGIVIEILNKFGYLGVILLIAIENIFPPIPSEVILTFGGFATTISSLTVFGTIVVATVGSVLGAIILYWIGRVLNEDRINKITKSKVGHFLGLKKEDIGKAYNWFNTRGKYAVFFGRLIPIVRSLVSIPAGMAKMPLFPFLVLTTVGSLIWNTALIMLGRIAGASWGKIVGYVDGYSNVVWIVFLIIFILGIWSTYIKNSGRVKIIRVRKSILRKRK